MTETDLFYCSIVGFVLISFVFLTQVFACVFIGLRYLCKCKCPLGHEEPVHAAHTVLFSDQMDSGFEESDSETSSFSAILIIENEHGGPLEEQLD